MGTDESASFGGKLSPAKQQAAQILAAGGTNIAAAEAVNVGVQTVSRWKTTDEVFQGYLAFLRRSSLESCRDRLRTLSGKAVQALERVLDDSDSKTDELIKAARAVLEHVAPFGKGDLHADIADAPSLRVNEAGAFEIVREGGYGRISLADPASIEAERLRQRLAAAAQKQAFVDDLNRLLAYVPGSGEPTPELSFQKATTAQQEEV